MKSIIQITTEFKKCSKKLLRKYPSLSDEIAQLSQNLKENPFLGKQIQENVYKIRLANKDKKAGKSSGFRVITYLIERKNQETSDAEWTVFLLFIYDKSKLSSVSYSDIKTMVEELANMPGPDPEAEAEETVDKPISEEAISASSEKKSASPDHIPPSENPPS